MTIRVGNLTVQFTQDATQWLGIWLGSALILRENRLRCINRVRLAEAKIQRLTSKYGSPLTSARNFQVAVAQGPCYTRLNSPGTEVSRAGEAAPGRSTTATVQRRWVSAEGSGGDSDSDGRRRRWRWPWATLAMEMDGAHAGEGSLWWRQAQCFIRGALARSIKRYQDWRQVAA